ncbi:MAG: undecaprenyl-diphosphate phosphatase [Planctomycetes bacterium]|nr:undecaprenyl-diphosphate phosphatase [Planctomycetota bacterium]
MTLWQAIVLGIVQGLTEFLPVSSTAHLRVIPELLGWGDVAGAAFTAVIQCGTLIAVLAYFRRDIARIGFAWFDETRRGEFGQSLDGRMGWMMIMATVPIVVCGLAFKSYIHGPLRNLHVIAWALIGLSVLLVAAELLTRWRQRSGRSLKALDQVGWGDAIWVGAAQAVALVPGVSRSGATITGGLFRGLSREAAARFSFLLSLPAILAAGLYELYSKSADLLGSQTDVVNLVVCTMVSGIVGYAAIAWLLAFLRTRTLYVFVVYRILLGGLLLGLLYNGTLKPVSNVATPTPAAETRGR